MCRVFCVFKPFCLAEGTKRQAGEFGDFNIRWSIDNPALSLRRRHSEEQLADIL